MDETISEDAIEEGMDRDHGWSDYDEWGVIDRRAAPPNQSRLRRLHTVRTARSRLYAIARGKGGVQTCGLYREPWDRVEALVNGYSKSRYKRVKSVKEGMLFIRDYFRSKGVSLPEWLRGKGHYPDLLRIRRRLGLDVRGMEVFSSDDSEASEYETDQGDEESEGEQVQRMGVDPSLGRDNELFGVNVKNVVTLEKGLSPPKLGKATMTLFLEQIDDVTAYPRHSSDKTSESLGDFVEAVTDMNNASHGRKGGTRDTGWKQKHRNSLEGIKSSEKLSSALSYLLEEQHNVLETCHGDLEVVLIHAQVEEDYATNIITNSLAMRIFKDTLHSFISLLNHLAGVNNTRGWEACLSQIKHHAEKVSLIRGKYRHRIQMVSKLYIYLRDGQAKNWMSLKIHHAEITALRQQMTRQGDGTGGTQGYNCSHCKSALHGGGKASCPWKDKSGTEAKRSANAFMVRMAEGGNTLTPPEA